MTAVLLTTAQLRLHLETDLSDEALQRLLDSEEAEIVRRYGDHETATEVLLAGGPDFILLRGALEVVSVVEEWPDGDPVDLAPEDYQIWHGGRLMQRAPLGQLWGPRVTVEYVPVDDSAQRTLVLTRLCQLAAAYSATSMEWVGDYRMTALDYQRERERLLRQVSPRQVMFA